MDKEKIYRKWRPVVESAGVKNNYLCKILSEWLEYNANEENRYANTLDTLGRSSVSGNVSGIFNSTGSSDIATKFKNVLSTLNNLFKVEVVKTYYNPVMSSFEYVLENGVILDDKGNFKNEELTYIELIDIFGVDFVKTMDVQKFRENRLDNIIYGVNRIG